MISSSPSMTWEGSFGVRRAIPMVYPAASTFYDPLFTREEKSVGFPALLAPRTASRRHSGALKPSLTSFRVVIYTSPRWLKGRMGIRMFIWPVQPKMKFLFLKI